jgi:hypothetical protein
MTIEKMEIALSVIRNKIWSKFQSKIEYEATMSSARFEEKSPEISGEMLPGRRETPSCSHGHQIIGK